VSLSKSTAVESLDEGPQESLICNFSVWHVRFIDLQNYFINGHHSMTDHTIDHLCPAHKAKVVELLKQLNELRKRCGFLESQIEAADAEEDRLERIHAGIGDKIEAEKQRLAEATSVAAAADDQIDRLAHEYEQIQSESGVLRFKIDESEQEVALLTSTYKQLRLKYDRVYADTGETIRATTIDHESQTGARHHLHAESQAPSRETCSEIFPDDVAFTWPSGELDAETNSLILWLNNR
jgi:chromosome segregation ATPase